MRVPETAIAAVENGRTVRLKGRVAAREPLRTSPLSQRRCIGFRLTVDTGGVEDQTERRVIDQQEIDPFVLADGTGEAVLHPPFSIELDPWDTGWQSLPSVLLDLLERERIPVNDFLGRRNNFYYTETVLLPGDELIAVGRATVEVDPASRAPSHREPPVVCQLKGGRSEPVVLVDADDVTGGRS